VLYKAGTLDREEAPSAPSTCFDARCEHLVRREKRSVQGRRGPLGETNGP